MLVTCFLLSRFSRAPCLSTTTTWGICWRRWSWEFSTCLTSSLRTVRTFCAAWLKWTLPRGSRYASFTSNTSNTRPGCRAGHIFQQHTCARLAFPQSSGLLPEGLFRINLAELHHDCALHQIFRAQAKDLFWLRIEKKKKTNITECVRSCAFTLCFVCSYLNTAALSRLIKEWKHVLASSYEAVNTSLKTSALWEFAACQV